MTNYFLIIVGITSILFGVYNGLIKREHTFLKFSRTPRTKYFKEKPSVKSAIIEAVLLILFGMLLISFGLN